MAEGYEEDLKQLLAWLHTGGLLTRSTLNMPGWLPLSHLL
jgi:hypothetical protein